jgi:hypothetical protein
MIVLVPANTPRQAVMDVLRKYLVLVPIAGFIALMVELAMQFLNGGLPLGEISAQRAGDNAPLMSEGTNLSAAGSADSSNMAPGVSPYDLANVSEGYLKSSGGISGHVTTSNTTIGVNGSDVWLTQGPPNGTGLLENQSNFGAFTPEVNRSVMTGPDLASPVPQPMGTSSGSHGLIPPDLLNHYGLWFFIGCLLIIGVMVAYEVYRGRKKKK